MFEQVEPFQLRQLLNLKHTNNSLTQYWDHTFSTLNIKNSNRQYVFYKSKTPQLAILFFRQSCLLLKKSFSVNYSKEKEITAVHSTEVIYPDKKETAIFILLGFFDGSIECYLMKEKQNDNEILSISIDKMSHVISKSQQPVTNIHTFYPEGTFFLDLWIFASKITFVSLYKKVTEKKEIIIKSKEKDTFSQKISISVTPNPNPSLYLFGQTFGINSYTLPHFIAANNINDLVISLHINYPAKQPHEIYDQKHNQSCNIVIGTGSDQLKFINIYKKIAIKYDGMKSFPSTICQGIQYGKLQTIWVGCLDGYVYCFQNTFKLLQKEKSQEMKFIKCNLKYGKKLTNNGIKTMQVCGNLMVTLQTEGDIVIYDILQKKYQ